jgi:NADPH:quinone reductase-like Zn-dependent oxidoreductase
MTTKPGVPEQDFSGTIAGGGIAGSGFKIGDEVYGALPVSSTVFHSMYWIDPLIFLT